MGFSYSQAACYTPGTGNAHAVGKKKKTGVLIDKNGVLVHPLASPLVRLPYHAH
jgi:hypothetical protein